MEEVKLSHPYSRFQILGFVGSCLSVFQPSSEEHHNWGREHPCGQGHDTEIGHYKGDAQRKKDYSSFGASIFPQAQPDRFVQQPGQDCLFRRFYLLLSLFMIRDCPKQTHYQTDKCILIKHTIGPHHVHQGRQRSVQSHTMI